MWKGTAECGGTGVRWRRCRGGAGDTGVDGFRVDSEIPLHPPPRSLHLECDRLYHRLDAVRCLLSAAPRAPSQQCLRACVRACRRIASAPVHCLNQVTCVYHASMGP